MQELPNLWRHAFAALAVGRTIGFRCLPSPDGRAKARFARCQTTNNDGLAHGKRESNVLAE